MMRSTIQLWMMGKWQILGTGLGCLLLVRFVVLRFQGVSRLPGLTVRLQLTTVCYVHRNDLYFVCGHKGFEK